MCRNDQPWYFTGCYGRDQYESRVSLASYPFFTGSHVSITKWDEHCGTHHLPTCCQEFISQGEVDAAEVAGEFFRGFWALIPPSEGHLEREVLVDCMQYAGLPVFEAEEVETLQAHFEEIFERRLRFILPVLLFKQTGHFQNAFKNLGRCVSISSLYAIVMPKYRYNASNGRKKSSPFIRTNFCCTVSRKSSELANVTFTAFAVVFCFVFG